MKIPEFLSGNLGLKFISLILAIVIYHVIKQSSETGDSKTLNDRSVFQAP